jgi:plasmid stabilization system protein ParE
VLLCARRQRVVAKQQADDRNQGRAQDSKITLAFHWRKTMPRGDKSAYTDKQKRKAEHIEESYEERGVSEKEAAARAWATVNKQSGGGNRSGSGRGRSASRKKAARKDSARRAVQTRRGRSPNRGRASARKSRRR